MVFRLELSEFPFEYQYITDVPNALYNLQFPAILDDSKPPIKILLHPDYKNIVGMHSGDGFILHIPNTPFSKK